MTAPPAGGTPDPGRIQWAGGRPRLAASQGERSFFPLSLLPLGSALPGRGRGCLVMANDALK